jgi:hypothetical protein
MMNYNSETSCGHRQCNLPSDSSSCSGYYGDRLIRRLTNSYSLPSSFCRRQFRGGILITRQGITRFGRRFLRSLQKIIFRRLVVCGLWIVRRRHRIGCSPDVCCLREGNSSEIFCARQRLRCSLFKVSREHRASIYAARKTTQPGWVAAGRVSPVMITGIQQGAWQFSFRR